MIVNTITIVSKNCQEQDNIIKRKFLSVIIITQDQSSSFIALNLTKNRL